MEMQLNLYFEKRGIVTDGIIGIPNILTVKNEMLGKLK